MKARNLRDIRYAVGRLVLMVLLLLPAVAWRGQLLGIKTDGTASEFSEMRLSVSDCSEYFNSVSEVRMVNKQQFQLLNDRGEGIGYALAYRGEKGYGGRVPLYILTNDLGVINGIILGKNYESKEYLRDVINSGLLNDWNGLRVEDAIQRDVDVHSGATITSQAIISGVQSALSGTAIRVHEKMVTIENIVSFILLLFLSFAYFYPKKMMKYRAVLQVFSVLVFGFWLTQFLSLAQIMSWLSLGIALRFHLIIGIIFVCSILLPVFFGKSFYCVWVCPFGAAQELCGKMKQKKLDISAKIYRWLNFFREFFFWTILTFLWLGFFFDVSYVEPFSAFSIHQASYFTLGLAGFFLVVSLFVPKAWCRFFCPTGYILQWIRK
ncbi:FMN-binding protein [Saccharicrinis fermentans]|uniref:Putative electron transport protein YccM n=1 Tax=Saccharicrinis fermentans DSM 9555 = JCM 21142 TaxID=869213 RepID=W7YHU2_9BACT|nr:4Fe-4S binding protein [Saccharicrinis fermentans]GAF04046.1 putative electron transport protein YccM [Saccharicrinis fermentans DSM 9555 = JCM 21142]